MTVLSPGLSPASLGKINNGALSDTRVFGYCLLLFLVCIALTLFAAQDDFKPGTAVHTQQGNVLSPDQGVPKLYSQDGF